MNDAPQKKKPRALICFVICIAERGLNSFSARDVLTEHEFY